MPKQKWKTDIITIRIPPDTKRKIQEKARHAHMTVTDYMTICALGPIILEPKNLNALLSELKAQGRNLNQLTTLANMGRISFVRGDEMLATYAELQRQLSELTKGAR